MLNSQSHPTEIPHGFADCCSPSPDLLQGSKLGLVLRSRAEVQGISPIELWIQALSLEGRMGHPMRKVSDGGLQQTRHKIQVGLTTKPGEPLSRQWVERVGTVSEGHQVNRLTFPRLWGSGLPLTKPGGLHPSACVQSLEEALPPPALQDSALPHLSQGKTGGHPSLPICSILWTGCQVFASVGSSFTSYLQSAPSWHKFT